MNAFITSIATANPEYKISQQEVLEFMTKAHQLNEKEAERLKILYRATGIQSRYSVIEDYQNAMVRNFYPDNESLEPFPSTERRADIFKKNALGLCSSASRKALQNIELAPTAITHLITVSCTGMYAPGIDIELIDELGLNRDIERTGINFMGCYAAFNAIKSARTICQAHPDANVLVACVELCSIHFQKEKTDDNLLANALFGDGAAALIMQGRPASGLSLETTAFHCDLNRKGGDDMAWKIGDFGFEMRLSSYIPDILKGDIAELIQRLKGKSKDEGFNYYAIHPGGKKILQVIEDELQIERVSNRFAHEVLREYGNMSSPTILFVIKRIWESLNHSDKNKNILALAFGPGLTLESMVLNIKYQ